MCDSPHQFQPLLPGDHLLAPLRERVATIVTRSADLGGRAHPVTRAALRELLRSMNSYYSNRIEGQSTTPTHIDDALRHNFSAKPEIARLQRIALAHIEAERGLEQEAAAVAPLRADFILLAHRALYGRLEAEDRTTKDDLVLIPGELRHSDVTVGHHVPPAWGSLPRFMEAFTQFYDRARSGDSQLIAIACAHQRMAWMHPFIDGNGRATRLQTHVAMLPVTQGLWSVNRGLARDAQNYYSHLAAADAPRQGDLDGRGNLTERGLLQWVDYFIRVCEDQVQYMSETLDLDSMKKKIEALIQFEVAHGRLRPEASLPLYYLFAAGPATRGEFIQMTGLAERTGRALLSELIKRGLVESDTSHAPVRFAFPLFALRFLFPMLYSPGE